MSGRGSRVVRLACNLQVVIICWLQRGNPCPAGSISRTTVSAQVTQGTAFLLFSLLFPEFHFWKCRGRKRSNLWELGCRCPCCVVVVVVLVADRPSATPNFLTWHNADKCPSSVGKRIQRQNLRLAVTHTEGTQWAHIQNAYLAEAFWVNSWTRICRNPACKFHSAVQQITFFTQPTQKTSKSNCDI